MIRVRDCKVRENPLEVKLVKPNVALPESFTSSCHFVVGVYPTPSYQLERWSADIYIHVYIYIVGQMPAGDRNGLYDKL